MLSEFSEGSEITGGADGASETLVAVPNQSESSPKGPTSLQVEAAIAQNQADNRAAISSVGLNALQGKTEAPLPTPTPAASSK